jgi:hypothetical protein
MRYVYCLVSMAHKRVHKVDYNGLITSMLTKIVRHPMKVFDTEEPVFDYGFFDKELNPLVKKPFCFKKHEIPSLIQDYFYEHADKDKETVTIVIALLEELERVLTALESYNNLSKDKIIAHCNLFESNIKSTQEKNLDKNQTKLIDGCIRYCTTAINKQINQMTDLPATDLFKRCENINHSTTMHL